MLFFLVALENAHRDHEFQGAMRLYVKMLSRVAHGRAWRHTPHLVSPRARLLRRVKRPQRELLERPPPARFFRRLLCCHRLRRLEDWQIVRRDWRRRPLVLEMLRMLLEPRERARVEARR